MQLIFALLLSIDTDLTSVSTVNIISNVAGRWKYECDCINKFLIYSTFHKHIALQFIHCCLKQELHIEVISHCTFPSAVTGFRFNLSKVVVK